MLSLVKKEISHFQSLARLVSDCPIKRNEVYYFGLQDPRNYRFKIEKKGNKSEICQKIILRASKHIFHNISYI